LALVLPLVSENYTTTPLLHAMVAFAFLKKKRERAVHLFFFFFLSKKEHKA
jgi:hypothetical protein